MKRYKTNILVRNNRLEQMQGRGVIVTYDRLSDAEYIDELKQKLVEEATEALNSKNTDELEEEIADILEVIEHLVDVNSLDVEVIEKIKEKKRTKLGGFDQKIKIHYVDVSEDSEDNEYYTARPEKYPEILD